MGKMLWDTQRALDVLAAWPGVDATRLGVIGHSLGAKQTLYVAAFDERARAAVFSEGGIGIQMCNWNAPWYLGDRVHRPDFTRDHAELLRLVAPRAFLLIAGGGTDGEESRAFIDAAMPAYERHDAGACLAFLNHGRGHYFPPEAQASADEWFDRWLCVQVFRKADPEHLNSPVPHAAYRTGFVSQRPVRLYMLMSGTTHGPPSLQRPPGKRSHCTCPSTKAKLLPSPWRGGSYGFPRSLVAAPAPPPCRTPGMASRSSVMNR
jgi:hypothetical protein